MKDVREMSSEELIAERKHRQQTNRYGERLTDVSQELLRRAPSSWSPDLVDEVYEIDVCEDGDFEIPRPFVCTRSEVHAWALYGRLRQEWDVCDLMLRRTWRCPYMGDVHTEKDRQRRFIAASYEGYDVTDEIIQAQMEAVDQQLYDQAF